MDIDNETTHIVKVNKIKQRYFNFLPVLVLHHVLFSFSVKNTTDITLK